MVVVSYAFSSELACIPDDGSAIAWFVIVTCFVAVFLRLFAKTTKDDDDSLPPPILIERELFFVNCNARFFRDFASRQRRPTREENTPPPPRKDDDDDDDVIITICVVVVVVEVVYCCCRIDSRRAFACLHYLNRLVRNKREKLGWCGVKVKTQRATRALFSHFSPCLSLFFSSSSTFFLFLSFSAFPSQKRKKI